MTPEVFRDLVALAALSPNVHNIQPSQWRLIDDNTLALVQAPSRHLPIGDPTGRDVAASHGAAAEGMIIAASAHGIGLELTEPHTNEVTRLTVTGSAQLDPLAPFLSQRRTYRGAFDKGRTEPARAALAALSRPDVRLIMDDDQISEIATLADQATMRAYRNHPFRQELTSWMRLTPRHKNWARDGLNAQAMAMAIPVALAAGCVMSHPVFEALDRLKLAAPLTAEATTTRSAAGLVALVKDHQADPFQTGRDWHRLWLELTRMGLCACPLTILADDPLASAEMSERLRLAAHQTLVTVLRVGMVDARRLPTPARLPLDELILD